MSNALAAHRALGRPLENTSAAPLRRRRPGLKYVRKNTSITSTATSFVAGSYRSVRLRKGAMLREDREDPPLLERILCALALHPRGLKLGEALVRIEVGV